MDITVLWQPVYGMYAIGVNDGGRPAGCIVNTMVQITADNPIVAVSVNKNNHTLGAMRRAGSFGVSILSEETRPAVISQLGFFSARDRDKYDGLQVKTTPEGIPLLDEACTGYLVCDILSMLDTETHVIVTARVRDAEKGSAGKPMSYAYYHEVIKGKAPKNAPTYRKETEAQAGEAYVCDVCGYVYEGDITKEPDSYVCPICKVDKSHFKRRT